MPNKQKTMKKIIINITHKEFDQLKKDSEDSGLSVSEIIRRMLDKNYKEVINA
jgi:hypothetical protein